MSMRDMIMKKYISILNEIITDYDNTKTEKEVVKINLIMYFI